MKRNSTQIELITNGITTWLPWIDDVGANRVDGYPDFSGFSGASRVVRESAWQAFLDSGEPLEIIPDPDPPTPEPESQWTEFNTALLSDPYWRTIASQLELTEIGKDIKTSLVANAGGANPGGLRSSYLIALQYLQSQEIPFDPAAIAVWNGYANQYSIPVSFDIP